MKVVKDIFKKQAIPGNAMFSYHMQTGEIGFVDQIEFTKNEAKNGTIKNYEFEKEDFKIYLQALSPEQALQKFQLFFKHKQDEKEKIKTSHPKLQE